MTDEISAGRAARAGRALVLAIGLVALLAARSGAGDDASADVPGDAALRARVVQWLDDLRSASFETRETARAGLERYAQAAPDLLEARKDDPDAEVRRTVRTILERLHGAAPPPPAPQDGDVEGVGRVTISANGPLSAVLERLGAPYGARAVVPGDAGGTVVALDLHDVPFFEALAQVAAVADLVAPGPFEPDGTIALRGADATPAVPSAASGPLRVRVEEVTSTRTLTRPGRRHHLVLDLDWMPAVSVSVWRTPTDLQAVDPDGRPVPPGAAMRSRTSWGAGVGATSGRFAIDLDPAADDRVERLARLEFALPVRLAVGRHDVHFDRPTDDLPRTLPPGSGPDTEGAVTLRSLARAPGNGPWVAEVGIRLAGETAERTLSLWLDRDDGTSVPLTAGTRFPSADGWLSIVARAWGRSEALPVRLRATWLTSEVEGNARFRLEDVPLR